MRSDIVLTLLVANLGTIYGDFYSGTISWEAAAQPPSTQVRIHGRYGFKFGSGPGCGGTPAGSFAGGLTNGNELACTQGCSPVQNITGGDLNYFCASYTNEWEQGDEFLLHRFPSASQFIVSYTGLSWIPHDFGSTGNVHFRTTINLNSRSDTGRPNSSPVTSSLPMYTIPMDCITSIQLPVFDPEDDHIACRWATGAECGGVCNGLPASKMDTQRCILTVQPKLVTGFKTNGVYVVTLMVEDFPSKTITVGSASVGPSTQLSQVPLQFLIKTVQKTGTCTDIPKIDHPTPQNGQVFIVPKGDTFTQRVYASFNSPATMIQDFVVSVPYDTRTSTLKPEWGNVYSMELSWQPSQTQYSTNMLCFQAVDNRGYYSEQHCFTILAGVDNPCDTNPCLNGASCRVELDSYTCSCAPGYDGRNCSIDINDCLSSPCKNGGTCMDQVNDYLCFCPVGFMGKKCEDIDHCSSSPCENFGTCNTNTSGYTCTCSTGYTGPRCQTELDECSSSPCENGATCVDMVGDFFCQCPIEYKGKNCSTPNDFCNPNPCLNGGWCTNYDNSYKCSCPRGYIGLDCEIYQPESCSSDDDNHCMCLLNGRRVKLPFPQEKQDGFTTDDLIAGIVGLPIGIATGVLACVLWHKLIRPRCFNGSSGTRKPRERPGSSSSEKSLISRDSTASPSDIRASVKSPVSMISPAFTNPYRPNLSTDWKS